MTLTGFPHQERDSFTVIGLDRDCLRGTPLFPATGAAQLRIPGIGIGIIHVACNVKFDDPKFPKDIIIIKTIIEDLPGQTAPAIINTDLREPLSGDTVRIKILGIGEGEASITPLISGHEFSVFSCSYFADSLHFTNHSVISGTPIKRNQSTMYLHQALKGSVL